MSDQLGPKKSLLKFKTSTPAQTVVKTPILHKSAIQQQPTESKPVQKIENPAISQPTQVESTKTEAEKAFDLIKKHRIIHKMSDKAKTSNKERLQKMNKLLSKLPDHYDLSRTGQKIQKGY